jgi:hypothetical protein
MLRFGSVAPEAPGAGVCLLRQSLPASLRGIATGTRSSVVESLLRSTPLGFNRVYYVVPRMDGRRPSAR